MATIVLDMTTNRNYVLIGVGHGESRDTPSVAGFIGPTIRSGSQVVAVADVNGNLSWLPAHVVQVVSVDGMSCRELLGESPA